MIKLIVSAAAMVLPLSLLAPQAPAEPAPAAQGTTLKIQVEYGDPGVRIPRGVARVRLTFRGQKGDAVQLNLRAGDDPGCSNVRLRDGSRTVAMGPDKFWRLPSRGRYTFDYRRCVPRVPGTVQLVKARIRPLPVDGRSVRLRSMYGPYRDAASVIVPPSGRVQVRPVEKAEDEIVWGSVLIPGGPPVAYNAWHGDFFPKIIYLEAGAPIASDRGEIQREPQAGDQVLLMAGENTLRVSATTARTVPGTLDGGPVPVSASVPFAEVGVQFSSEGDQWVAATVGGSLGGNGWALVGPEGHTLVGLLQAQSHSTGPAWYLPTAGSYRLLVGTDPKRASGTITLSSVRELDTAMPTDGRPLAFTAQKPGDWMLAYGELADEPYQLDAVGTGATQWIAIANAVPFTACREEFCNHFAGTSASPSDPGHYWELHKEGRWIFVVGFGAGQTGTVNVKMTPLRNLPPPA